MMSMRRSVKPMEMREPGPNAAQLALLLKIAARVPDHGKLAPWRFIVFEGEGRGRAGQIFGRIYKEQHPDAEVERISTEQKRFLYAPVVVGLVSSASVHVKIPVWEQELSAGAVGMNLTLAAKGMGFRSAWLTDWMAYDRAVLAELGLATHEKIAGFIHIGSTDAQPDDRARPEMSQIITKF